jgi:hypothetical protein
LGSGSSTECYGLEREFAVAAVAAFYLSHGGAMIDSPASANQALVDRIEVLEDLVGRMRDRMSSLLCPQSLLPLV